MSQPPENIDGAKVLSWAWSGAAPFGFVGSEPVYGLAICQYPSTGTIYRFSCGGGWETLQDSDYETVEEAKENVPGQYLNAQVTWKDNV